MDLNEDILSMIERLDKSNRAQVRYARLQCIFSAVAAVCCFVLLAAACSFIPQVQRLSIQAQQIVGQTQELASQTETVLNNLETVSEELAQADLGGMVDNVDSLVTYSQTAVAQATQKLDAIDIETLNKAISDLADIVEPLAKFFNVFN